MSDSPGWDAAVTAIRDTARHHGTAIVGDVAEGEPMLGRWTLVTEWIDDDGTGKPAVCTMSPETQASWETAGLLSWAREMVGLGAWRADEGDV